MASYHLHVSEEPPTIGKRIRESLGFTALLLLGLSGLQRLEYGHWGPPVVWIITGAICFLGGILTSSWPAELQTFDFQIDDFGIRSFWNGKPFRRVRSSAVHYVRERRDLWAMKLIISEESSFFKRRFTANRVVLIKRLFKPEEYDQIKAMALGWLENSAQ